MRDEIRVQPYSPDRSGACLELERACPQGEAYRLSFRRDAFHRRAESFADRHLRVALQGDRVVGVIAWAIKNVVVRGTPERAGFLFDLRVHPDARRQGAGTLLAQEAFRHLDRAGATLRYTYAMEDNRALRQLSALFGCVRAGSYRYLVWPVYRERRAAAGAVETTPEVVHALQRGINGPFDFYSDPFLDGSLQGHLLSLRQGEEAGASVWSNAGLLEEVVERIPRGYRVARALVRTWPLRLVRWPHIPGPGEALRSWYVHDFFARSPRAARELMRAINNLAWARGIRFCYLLLAGRPAWEEGVRADTPRWCSPLVPYSLLVSPAEKGESRFERPYVDVRDL